MSTFPLSTMPVSELWDHLGIETLRKAIVTEDYVRLCRTLLLVSLLALYFVAYKIFSVLSYPFTLAVPRTREIHRSYFAQGFWTLCCFILEMNRFKIIVTGDKLEFEDALFISNHRSLVDHIVFTYLVTEDEEIPKGVPLRDREKTIFAKDQTSLLRPRLSFFTWFRLWEMPGITFWKNISQTDENWELDSETLASTFSPYLESLTTGVSWLVTFPEVNIFTKKSHKVEEIMGEKYYLPEMNNVLYPRFSGFANAIGGLYKTHFHRIYDTTLVYFQKDRNTGEVVSFEAPNLLEAFGLTDKELVVLVHIHGKMMSRVPNRRDKMEKWLERRWSKKDKLIEKLQSDITAQYTYSLN